MTDSARPDSPAARAAALDSTLDALAFAFEHIGGDDAANGVEIALLALDEAEADRVEDALLAHLRLLRNRFFANRADRLGHRALVAMRDLGRALLALSAEEPEAKAPLRARAIRDALVALPIEHREGAEHAIWGAFCAAAKARRIAARERAELEAALRASDT